MAVPPRWLNCPRKSNFIAEKFLAFKTFLDSRYDEKVPEENRWQFPMLLGYLNRNKRTLGLVIDLTNTERFYDRNELQNSGIQYTKINCRGHGETPNEEQTQEFIRICSKFWQEHHDKMIGVHCTHGFNRTGFLIMSYLVQVCDWSLEAAFREFSTNRSPGIYKQQYLDELCRRYDSTESLQGPELPDWCLEEEEGNSDNETPNGSREDYGMRSDGGRKRMRREFKTSEPKFVDGVTGVTIANLQTAEEVQHICQDMCGWNRDDFPGSQPVSMDVSNIRLLSEKAYRVTWKADGVRYMMYIKGLHEIFLIDRDNAVFEAPQFTFPQRKDPNRHVEETLLDGSFIVKSKNNVLAEAHKKIERGQHSETTLACLKEHFNHNMNLPLDEEMVMDKNDEKLTPRYLIYDVVHFQGQQVGKMSHDVRMRCIDIEIVQPRNKAVQAGTLDKTKEPFSIRSKQFFPVEKAEWILKEFNPKLTHENDGLIFNAVDEEYIPGACAGLLKWKPHTLNSVDFQLHITTVQKEGCLKEKVGALRVGGCDRPVDFIKITNELKTLDKKIIECTYDGKQWVFMRVRHDKSFPNSYATAHSVCQSIKQPVTQQWLLEVIGKHRFKPATSHGHGHGHSHSHGASANHHGHRPPHDHGRRPSTDHHDHRSTADPSQKPSAVDHVNNPTTE